MKLWKILLCGLLLALPVFAEEADDRQTATSLHYVSHELDTRQNKLSAGSNKALTYTNTAGNIEQRTVKSDLNGGSTTDTSLPQVNAVNAGLGTKQNDITTIDDHTAVTYTGQTGTIGQKGIYQATGTYAEQTDNLIDAKTFNAALKNGLDSEFVCDEDNKQPVTDTCWLWKIHTTGTNGTLPPEYTELEYIRFSGGQFLDTHFIMQQSANPKVELIITNKTGPAFGAQSVQTRALLDYDSRIYCGNGTNRLTYSLPTNDGVPHTLAASYTSATGNLSISVDGAIVNSGIQAGSFPTDTNYYLGSINGGTMTGELLTGDVRRFRIYQNNNIVVNLVPAKNSSGVIGMYDTVSNEFRVNQGADSFIAGPEINNIIYVPQNQ